MQTVHALAQSKSDALRHVSGPAMRRVLLTTWSVLFAARRLVAKSPTVQSDTRVPMLSASDAQVDFDVLRRALEEAHGVCRIEIRRDTVGANPCTR